MEKGTKDQTSVSFNRILLSLWVGGVHFVDSFAMGLSHLVSDFRHFFYYLVDIGSYGDFTKTSQLDEFLVEIIHGVFVEECSLQNGMHWHVHCKQSFQGSEETVIDFS